MSDLGQTNGYATPVDIGGLTAGELRRLIAEAETALVTRQEQSKTDLLAKWQAEAAEAGLLFQDVLGATPTQTPEKPRRQRSDAGARPAPKFRDPETGKTWSGRGREPAWLAGRDRDKFRVDA